MARRDPIAGGAGLLAWLMFLLTVSGPVLAETKTLVDVVDGVLFDGWGEAAAQTLPMYYAADTSANDLQMLKYRPSFLPVFDWGNGVIDEDAQASDLYSFYESGAGASRVQSSSDPAYTFSLQSRYQEPAGRLRDMKNELRTLKRQRLGILAWLSLYDRTVDRLKDTPPPTQPNSSGGVANVNDNSSNAMGGIGND